MEEHQIPPESSTGQGKQETMKDKTGRKETVTEVIIEKLVGAGGDILHECGPYSRVASLSTDNVRDLVLSDPRWPRWTPAARGCPLAEDELVDHDLQKARPEASAPSPEKRSNSYRSTAVGYR